MSDNQEIRLLREQVALLTRRVYRLEQLLDAVPQTPQAETPIAEQVSASTQPSSFVPTEKPAEVPSSAYIPPTPPYAVTPAQATESLESRIGSQWLNRIGIIAVLVGISYFLKYAFENNWIGPGTRVLIGLVAGLGIAAWSESFRRKGFRSFSYSLKAVGIGVLYLSLWAACQLYALVPQQIAFFAMLVVTGATAWIALAQDSEILAGLALLGGFLTPVLVSTGRNEELALFSYLLLLDVAALVLQRFRDWPRIAGGAWLGTVILYVAWAQSYYAPGEFSITLFFISGFFAVFAAVSLVSRVEPRGAQTDFAGGTVALLPVFNAGTFFLQCAAIVPDPRNETLALYAVVLAAAFASLSFALERRLEDARASDKLLPTLHAAIAVGFITIAIPLRLHGSWITLGWLIESAALFWSGVRGKRRLLRTFGALAAALGVLHLVIDSWEKTVKTPFFNERFALYLAAIAVVAFTLWLERSQPEWKSILRIAGAGAVLLNLLALIALNLEVRDIYAQHAETLRQTYGAQLTTEYFASMRALGTTRDFTYSAVWMFYGVLLMWAGFSRRSAFLRWQAIVLVGATILKVFLYDVSALDRGYRIVSFIVLGAILLGISFVYQRDWLGLQKRAGQ